MLSEAYGIFESTFMRLPEGMREAAIGDAVCTVEGEGICTN